MSGSPHVALLTGWYYPDTVGGTEAYVQTLAHDLQDDGYRVTVAAPSTDGEQSYVHNGVDVYRYPITSTPSTDEVRGDVPPEHLDAFAAWLDETAPDLVHAHSYTRGCSVHHSRCVRERSIPFFATVHIPEVTCPRGTMMRWGTTPCDGTVRALRCGACALHDQGMPRPFAVIAAAVSQTGISRRLPGRLGTVLQYGHQILRGHDRVMEWFDLAERVVVVSGWLDDVLRRNDVPPENIVVSRHGLPASHIPDDPRPVRCLAEDEPLRVGFVGRFVPIKGVDVLIDAVRHLPASVPVALDLYGTVADTQRDYYERLKERAASDARITFSGELTSENRHRVYASFDVVAVPSQVLETGPFVVLEAFAAHRPVVGSNLGGIAERVDEIARAHV